MFESRAKRFARHIGWMDIGMARGVALLLQCILLLSVTVAYAKNYPGYYVDGKPLTPQETWVLDQVAEGRDADLKAKFGEEENYLCIRASFLERLITGGFNKLEIKRRGVRIYNATILEPLDLEDAEITNSIWLVGCIFKEWVNLQACHSKKLLVLSRSQFLKEVSFHRFKTDNSVICRGAIFQGQFEFFAAKIDNQFVATGSQFLSKEGKVNFNAMNVGQGTFFDGAKFQGQVDFGMAHIGTTFNADGTKFQGPVDFADATVGTLTAKGSQFEKEANFNGITVRSVALLDCSKFQGEVNFANTNIGMVIAKEVQFEKEISFNGMKVEKNAIFSGAKFQGSVDFITASIAGQLNADGAQFYKDANFNGLRVEKSAFFRDTTFKGEVLINYTTFGDLAIIGEKNNRTLRDVILVGSIVNRDMLIANIQIDKLEASHLQVKGSATFEKVKINSLADFRYSIFKTLVFNDMTWGEERESIWLDGMTYESISAGKKPDGSDDWHKLFTLIEHSRFHPQNYAKLEDYLVRSGHKDKSDEAFICGKRRELRQMSWWNPARWITYIFWDRLVGYGRNPAQILWLIVPLILIGAYCFPAAFDPEFKLALMNHYWIQKFLLSIDRFLPGVDLGLAKHWQPSSICLFTWIYWYVLKIFGWITIPIVLAAIYTKIK